MQGVLVPTWSSSVCLLHVDLTLLSSNMVLQVLQELLWVRCGGPGALVCVAPKEDSKQALHERWVLKVHSRLWGVQAAALAQQLVPTSAGNTDNALCSVWARDLNMPRDEHTFMGNVPAKAGVIWTTQTQQAYAGAYSAARPCVCREQKCRPLCGYIGKGQTYWQAAAGANGMQAACASSHSLSVDREHAEQAAQVGQAHLLTASWGSTAATR